MNEDRELLELAAKAAGIEGEWARGYHAYRDCAYEGIGAGGRFLWNPLTDDGDALRLAVKLNMHVALFEGSQETRAIASDSDEWEAEGWECGKEAATRRAIVRAAAEIGKAL